MNSKVSDYDVVGVFEGAFEDFRSELGMCFLAECKDWTKKANFTTVAKFCRVLDSTKSRFGTLFSSEGVSGTKNTRFDDREVLKVFHERGIVIVVVSKADLDRIAQGGNFITMFRGKYTHVRLDLNNENYG